MAKKGSAFTDCNRRHGVQSSCFRCLATSSRSKISSYYIFTGACCVGAVLCFTAVKLYSSGYAQKTSVPATRTDIPRMSQEAKNPLYPLHEVLRNRGKARGVHQRSGSYNFSKIWFFPQAKPWPQLKQTFKNKKVHVLEIGAFEGVATTWILTHVALHPESVIVTIDTFKGGDDIQNVSFDSLYSTFLKNLHVTGESHKVAVLVGRSFEHLMWLNLDGSITFDIIYIDGSHLADDVISDAVLSWPLLKYNGTMIFDDYTWNRYREPYNVPKMSADAFARIHAADSDVIIKSHVLVLRKVKRHRSMTIKEARLPAK